MREPTAPGGCRWRAVLVVLCAVLAACAPLPQRAGVPTVWWPSPNLGERKPQYVILHYTGSDRAERALRALTDPAREVSAHYLVRRDGLIYQLVDERARAWHAGESRWGADTDLNSSSLGVEIDNDGREPFPESQVAALLALLRDIAARHRIPVANYLGHGDVAPRRKEDPGRLFPWRQLAQHGFGLWCDPPLPEPPVTFDVQLGLRAFGYDTGDLRAATHVFKLRFLPDDLTAASDDRMRATLYCLLQAAGRAGRSTASPAPAPPPASAGR